MVAICIDYGSFVKLFEVYGPHIAFFSNNLISHPQQTRLTSIILCVLLVNFLDRTRSNIKFEWLNCRPQDVGFSSASAQMLEKYMKVGHGVFLPYFITVPCLATVPNTLSYIAWATDGVVDNAINESIHTYWNMTPEGRNCGATETTIARKQLSKHVPAAKNTQTTVEVLLGYNNKKMFSVGSAPKLYNEDPRRANNNNWERQ
jgi:hypothetical protein